jgi:threonyl-tRNA synthetase
MQEDQIFKVRHSLSHLMSMAVLDIFGRQDVGLGVGPVIENGFYQDYDLGDAKLAEDDLAKIEKKIRGYIAKNVSFDKTARSVEEALAFYGGEAYEDPYKKELIEDLAAQGETEVSFYVSDWYDNLCKGPHVAQTNEIDPEGFKLMSVAGAYWRGDEKNKMLTRIYGVAFENKEALDAHLAMLEEAKKRDHRKLGKELEIYAFDEQVGPGLPLWLPNGTVLVEELEALAKQKEAEQGYKRVRSPHIAKADLYHTSGHLPYYEDGMFPAMELDNEKYYLKAMNCPHHHKMFAATPKSYRDLPLRFAEYGHCYRYEDSGSLFGLMRVRSLCMNDAHIYCTDEQFEAEFTQVIELYLYYFELFGIEKYQMRLSKHSKEGLGKKYVDNEALWIKTEDQVRQVLQNLNVPFVEEEDEAAFYGPKIDVQIWSVIGREFTLATNQLDFAVPERFNLKYTDSDGEEKTPICIHRAPLSTHERMIGFLLEHFAGAFPVWLAPTQVRLLNVADRHQEKCDELAAAFRAVGGRVELDYSSETIGNKIRKAAAMKIPYTIVVGDKEVDGGDLQIKVFGSDQKLVMSVDAFLQYLQEKIATRSLEK